MSAAVHESRGITVRVFVASFVDGRPPLPRRAGVMRTLST